MSDNKDRDNENIDFSDGISFKEAKFAFGVISFAVALVAGIAILAFKGDVGENWAWVLGAFFAALTGEGLFSYLKRK